MPEMPAKTVPPNKNTFCVTLMFLVNAPLSRHSSGSSAGSKDLLGRALDDTSRDGQVGVVLEVQVNLTRGLATLIDTPERVVSIGLEYEEIAEGNLTKQSETGPCGNRQRQRHPECWCGTCQPGS